MAGGDSQQDERGGGRVEETEVEERTDMWMATYADMVTLLMTFFVLMFAISSVDSGKVALMFAAFSRDGLDAETYAKIMELYPPVSEDFEDDKIPPPGPSPTTTPTPPKGPAVSREALDSLAAMISSFIRENSLGDSISLVYNGDFLLLTLTNDVWFRSGSAEITEEMHESAMMLADLINRTQNDDDPFEIVVAGHTDNVPVAPGGQYDSNWDVSIARATNFLKILIIDSELDPGLFYARGYGEERPLADNDTEEGRQQNRRVEVMISLRRELALQMPVDYELSGD